MAAKARITLSLTRPGCYKHLRWSGSESSRVRCPSCRTRFVALVRPSGECAAVLEDEAAIGQMVADWLRPNWDDEDDFSPEAQATGQVVGRTSGPTEASGVPTATPVIVPPPDGGVVTQRVPQPDDAPTRKVG